MLFVHEVHSVMGKHEFDFRDRVQEDYAPAVAKDDDSRLLWYLHMAHGSGEAYAAITITALADSAAWERFNERLRYGDLSSWLTDVSAMRWGCVSSLLVSTEWSPLGDLSLAAVPVTGDHPLTLIREDTIEGPGVAAALGAARRPEEKNDILRPFAAFRPAFGLDESVKVLYRVAEQDTFAAAYDVDLGWGDWAGSLTPTMPDNCTGAGRFLHPTSWSPMS